jgi:hypothetical protein
LFLIPEANPRSASPLLRDKFLNALEANDRPALRAIAKDLVGCINLLPTGTCTFLGLRPGSTYGDGADAVADADTPQPDAA